MALQSCVKEKEIEDAILCGGATAYVLQKKKKTV
jgi:hypothetical protein